MSEQKTYNVYGSITIYVDRDIDASSEEEAIAKVLEEMKDERIKPDRCDLDADDYDKDDQ